MRRTNRIWWPAAALLLLVGACTNGADHDTSESSDNGSTAEEGTAAFPAPRADSAQEATGPELGASRDMAADDAPDRRDGTAVGASGGGAGGLVPSGLSAVDHGRDIVFTARLEVEVDDVAGATLEAVTAVQALGGVVFGQETTTRPSPVTMLVIKVPPDRFQAALAGLGDVGFLRSQQISADDVTERVVDLESRIVTATASVARLRAFLDGATELSAVAQLEAELLRRETDLELLRGQLRTVQDQVSLATITVTIAERVPGPDIDLAATFVAGALDGGPIACPGVDGLTVAEHDSVIVCFSVTNTGDTHLADLAVSDPAFDIEPHDLVLVSGDPEVFGGRRPLTPGETLVTAAGTEAESSRASLARVKANPVDAEGNALPLTPVVDGADAWLTVEPDDSLPGFLAGFGAGWAVLQRAVSVVVVGLGFLLPFIWAIPVLWWAGRRLRIRRAPAPTAGSTTMAPPPPVTITPGD